MRQWHRELVKGNEQQTGTDDAGDRKVRVQGPGIFHSGDVGEVETEMGLPVAEAEDLPRAEELDGSGASEGS